MLKRLLSVVLSMVIILSSLASVGIQTALADINSWAFDNDNDYSISDTTDLGLGGVSFTASDIAGDLGTSNGTIMGDVDGDGDLDIYVTTEGAQNKLWINDGSGNFVANDIVGDENYSQYAAMGDVDGDGDLDIYTPNGNAADNQNKLWINDGSGNFVANDIVGDNVTFGSTAVMGDVDGDGDLDIYVANGSDNQNSLWINDGSGNFVANDIVGDIYFSESAAMGDVDGDGDLDIYVANAGAQNKLWINDGTGSFVVNDIVGDADYSYDVVMGDIDGDGDLDIYVANGDPMVGDAQNKLWINDGSGNFTANDIANDLGMSKNVTVKDVDGDGDLDIYVANTSGIMVFGDIQNKLWINNGTGSFAISNILDDLNKSFGSVIGDINGDGDLDIYVVNADSQQNKLWINNGFDDVALLKGPAPYSILFPYITPTTPQTFSSSLISFTETLGTNNEGSLTYQVSATNGVTW